jgi:hypothetical protein
VRLGRLGDESGDDAAGEAAPHGDAKPGGPKVSGHVVG